MGSFVKLISQALCVDGLSVILVTQFLGTIILVVMMFIFFNLLLKKTDHVSSIMMILLFIVIGAMGFYFSDWGELDIYMIPITLVASMLIIKDKHLWLIPFLSAICVLIHEGFVLMFFGIILALLLYRAGVETDTTKRKNYWLCLFSTGFIASALFVYFYFFSTKISRDHIDEILLNAEKTLNFSFQENSWALKNMKYIFAGFGLPNNPMLINGLPTNYFFLHMLAVLMNLLVCLPVILTLIDFWKTVIQSSTDRRKKVFITLCVSLQLLTIPLVLIHTDQARWFYDFVYFNFILIASVICIGDKEFSLAAEKCFAPSIVKGALFVFYFVFFLSPDSQLINNYYSMVLNRLFSFIANSF